MTPKEELQKTQEDLTEGGGGNPLILPSPEDQDPLASLLPWLQPLFSHFFLANRAHLFLYLPMSTFHISKEIHVGWRKMLV